jgi:hypothetical protein
MRKIIEEVKRLKEENKAIRLEQWQNILNQKYQRLKQVVNNDMLEDWIGLEFELSVMCILNLYGCNTY